MQRSPDSLFVEEQPLRDNKLLYLALVIGLGTIVFFGYAMYRQLLLGRPFGDRPMGDPALFVIGLFYILVGVLLLWLFFRGALVTEVRQSGLFVRYYPFHRTFRRIPLEGLLTCEARTYGPIREYGGWGIRVGMGKRAYNVSGNRGVELKYGDGKTLLIGSRKAEQLAGAIDSIRR
jgi:hypothetical protein